ncbi:MAG TPA: hypothetical protein VEI03_23565 [Stellaceae bacterium]|nr:hypothetical protein [Stellaceae bacterium]
MAIRGSGRSPAIALALLLLAGCAGDSTAYYAPPPGLTPDRAVSILGSKDAKFFLQSSEYHLVWAVDGRVVKDSAWRWDRPLLVTAGEPHRLGIAYGWGGIAGGTDVEFTGRAGSTVVVEGEAVDPDKLARLWLADAATGAVIGRKQPVALSWFPAPPLPLNTDEIAIKLIDKAAPR